MSLRRSAFAVARAVSLPVLAIALQPAFAEPAQAQFFGWSERPRPAKSVHRTRQKADRRAASDAAPVAAPAKAPANAPAPAKKAEAKPEIPQMMFAVVSLADQRISIYGAEGLITRSAVSTGQAGHRTPTGIFTILEKQRWHESNIYSGAPMPFMQRVTWSGIAMHEGIVPGYPASHGCIRLPAAFAAKLWGMTKPGYRVILASQDLQPFEFAHPNLPVPTLVPAALLAAPKTPSEPRVTLASNDPEAGTTMVGAERLAAVGPGPAGGETTARMLNPLEAAIALRAKATSDLAQARKTAEMALLAAREASRVANAASADLKDARMAVADATADLVEAEAKKAKAALVVPASTADAPTASTAPTSAGVNPAVEAADAAVKTAADALAAAEARLAAAKAADDAASPRSYELASAAREAHAAIDAAEDTISDARRRLSPVSVVVSRKTGTVMVRQGQKPVYEAPVTIANPEAPLGTHVFIAIEESGDASGLDWAPITVPTPADDGFERKPARAARKGERQEALAEPLPPPSSAEDALDRIEMPEGARKRIAELIWVGGSLVITDRGLSNESGESTDLNLAIP